MKYEFLFKHRRSIRYQPTAHCTLKDDL
nr:unnamed protein product [Callosobruchus analis]